MFSLQERQSQIYTLYLKVGRVIGITRGKWEEEVRTMETRCHDDEDYLIFYYFSKSIHRHTNIYCFLLLLKTTRLIGFDDETLAIAKL